MMYTPVYFLWKRRKYSYIRSNILFQLVNLKLNSKKCNIYFTVYRHNLEDRACPFIICQQKTRKLTKVKVSLCHHVDLYPVITGLHKNWFFIYFYTFTLHFEYLHLHQHARPAPTARRPTRNTLHPMISRSIDEVSANVVNWDSDTSVFFSFSAKL